MAETERKWTPEDIRQVISLAIGAAGSSENVLAWKGRINANIPLVASMLGEDSNQWKLAGNVLSAHRFLCTYRGYKLEETSQRLVVSVETKPSRRYPDGIEPLRTDRVDTTSGRRMKALLDELTDGDRLVVWRYMDEAKDAHGDDISVRMLVHFEKIGSAKASDQRTVTPPVRQEGPSSPPHGQTDAEGADADPNQRPAPSASKDRIDDILDHMTSRQKVRAVTRLRAAGYTHWNDPPADVAQKVIGILEQELAHGD